MDLPVLRVSSPCIAWGKNWVVFWSCAGEKDSCPVSQHCSHLGFLIWTFLKDTHDSAPFLLLTAYVCVCLCVFFFFLNRLKGLHMLKWSTESWSVPFGHCCEREVKEKGKDQNCAQNSICNTRGTLWLVFPSRNISLCTFWVSSSFFCPSLLL